MIPPDLLIERLGACGIVPVVVVASAQESVRLARALLAGGIDVIELTLRSPAGLDAIAAVSEAVPDMLVIAGTVLSPAQMREAKRRGARLAVSPGFTQVLSEAADEAGLPYMPGVATPSEVMGALACGRRTLKLFPAAQAGGIAMLRALAGPFAEVRFCPTGGIGPKNAADYLAEPNVLCVGGSWLAPRGALAAGDFGQVTALARDARTLAGQSRGEAA